MRGYCGVSYNEGRVKKFFLICALIVVTGISIFAIGKFGRRYIFYMPQPVVALYVKGYFLRDFTKQKVPIVYIKPITRQVQTLHYEHAMSISHAGIKFNVPWENFIKKRKIVIPYGKITDKKWIKQGLVKKSDKSTLFFFAFPKNKGVMVSDVQIPEQATAVYMRRDRFMKAMLKEKNLKSDYDAIKSFLNVNPDEITWFTPKKKLQATWFLTIMKSVIIPEQGKCGIYEFNTKNVKGFQFGNPQKCDTVILRLFSKEGLLLPVNLSGKKLNQKEIDFILSSLSTY